MGAACLINCRHTLIKQQWGAVSVCARATSGCPGAMGAVVHCVARREIVSVTGQYVQGLRPSAEDAAAADAEVAAKPSAMAAAVLTDFGAQRCLDHRDQQ